MARITGYQKGLKIDDRFAMNFKPPHIAAQETVMTAADGKRYRAVLIDSRYDPATGAMMGTWQAVEPLPD